MLFFCLVYAKSLCLFFLQVLSVSPKNMWADICIHLNCKVCVRVCLMVCSESMLWILSVTECKKKANRVENININHKNYPETPHQGMLTLNLYGNKEE